MRIDNTMTRLQCCSSAWFPAAVGEARFSSFRRQPLCLTAVSIQLTKLAAAARRHTSDRCITTCEQELQRGIIDGKQRQCYYSSGWRDMSHSWQRAKRKWEGDKARGILSTNTTYPTSLLWMATIKSMWLTCSFCKPNGRLWATRNLSSCLVSPASPSAGHLPWSQTISVPYPSLWNLMTNEGFLLPWLLKLASAAAIIRRFLQTDCARSTSSGSMKEVNAMKLVWKPWCSLIAGEGPARNMFKFKNR